MSEEKKAEQDERGAFAAIHEFLGVASKRLYPTPDKPNSDWAKLREAVDALALIHEARAASTSANVAQYQTKLRNPILPECDVWINVSEEGARTAREKYSDVYEVWELFERSANVAQGAEAVAEISKRGEYWIDKWFVEAINALPDGTHQLYAAPPAQTALTDDARDAARYQLLRRGQHWSVINGIGDTLRAEKLDEAIDAALTAAQSGDKS